MNRVSTGKQESIRSSQGRRKNIFNRQSPKDEQRKSSNGVPAKPIYNVRGQNFDTPGEDCEEEKYDKVSDGVDSSDQEDNQAFNLDEEIRFERICLNLINC